jgi:hypothetical protein
MRPSEDMSRRHLVGGAHLEQERPQHPGVALDGPAGARAPLLLGQEGDDRLLPGRDIVRGGSGKVVRIHRRRLASAEWTPPSVTQVATESNTMPGWCLRALGLGSLWKVLKGLPPPCLDFVWVSQADRTGGPNSPVALEQCEDVR